jgi:hypothetical protein
MLRLGDFEDRTKYFAVFLLLDTVPYRIDLGI